MVRFVNLVRWSDNRLSLGLPSLVAGLLLAFVPLAQAAEPGDTLPEPLPQGVSTEQKSSLPSLDELLATDAGVDYDQSKRCLPLHKFEEVKALDENHIVFELHRDKYYLVQLERRCPGLLPQNAVGYEHRSSRLCEMDSVRGIRVTGGFSPSCQLGRFQPVTEEQLALLEEALKHRAQNPTSRGKPLKDPKPIDLPGTKDEIPGSKS